MTLTLILRCLCQPGFHGNDCSEDKNECLGNLCQNGAACKDGRNTYECLCREGYVGRYCESPTMDNALYPKTSPCQHHDCQNVQNNVTVFRTN